jgi:hypothetical protein
MKYLISFWNNSKVENSIVKDIKVNSIQDAIQYHENEYGLEYCPIINVFELSDSFTSEIYNEG